MRGAEIKPTIRAVLRRVVPAPIRRRVRRARRSADQVSAAAPGADQEADLGRLIAPYVPNDHARQVNANYYLERLMRSRPSPKVVMDLGCGRGDSVDRFRASAPDVDWVGVDIPLSQEVAQRQRTDARFVTYDGQTLPFEDATFDLVYSEQVLEHVRDPVLHLREIGRVLRPGGALIGSTSQLEPYHSRSYWNYTVFGFAELVAEAGLGLEELRPGIDGVTLVLRSYLGRPASFLDWFKADSPLNTLIDDWAREKHRPPAETNLRKLQYAGQFAFLIRRPSA
jgi:SAM-dependent methyltransferase